jgi:membrane carboxypeptidase/penicillin-binding protein PbpC
LLDLTAAYGVFANGGARVEPVFIEEILAADGAVLYSAKPTAPIQVMDERVAWLISDILSDNQARTPAFGPNSVLRIDRNAAVKTGTTNNFHDNWTVGYTPELVVGVWVGNANNEAMRDVTGVSGAGPIWHQAIRAFLAGEPDRPFVQPPGLVRVEVCRLSGLLPTEDCPYRRWEWFLAGTQPVGTDSYFRQVMIDRRTGKLAAEDANPAYTESQLVLDLPPVFHVWAREQGLPLLVDLMQTAEPTLPGETDTGPVGPWIAYPDPNAVFYLSTTIPPEAQRILVKVVSGENYGQLTLWLDGRLLTTFTEPPYEFWWQLEPGEHQFSVTGLAADGSTVSGPVISFVVREMVE